MVASWVGLWFSLASLRAGLACTVFPIVLRRVLVTTGNAAGIVELATVDARRIRRLFRWPIRIAWLATRHAAACGSLVRTSMTLVSVGFAATLGRTWLDVFRVLAQTCAVLVQATVFGGYRIAAWCATILARKGSALGAFLAFVLLCHGSWVLGS